MLSVRPVAVGSCAGSSLSFSAATTLGRNIILDVEHVGQLAIVGLRPQCRTVRGTHQLRGDAQGVALLAYAAFQQVATFSARAIVATSTCLPLNENDDVRAITRTCGNCASWFNSSSDRPSEK